jgi:hypothetical protein
MASRKVLYLTTNANKIADRFTVNLSVLGRSRIEEGEQMTYTVDLRGQVPLYGQQQCIWCGAATAQMLMDGYPDPAHRLFFSQQDIYNTIRAHNSTNPMDVNAGWATDPDGLCETLRIMNPPPGPHTWVPFEGTSDSVLHGVLLWMDRLRYPVATLINRGGHWVAIVGFISDVAPDPGPATLQYIMKYDPEPHNQGSSSTMTANVWDSTDWNGAVMYAGSWLNQYVAIVEPPKVKGFVKIEKVIRIGKEIIPPERAVELVKQWVKEGKIPNKQQHALLTRKDLTILEPVLVTEHSVAAEKPATNPRYYIVPFGLEREKTENEPVLARMCVIVNAFTGKFEEVTTFGRAVRYLREKEAIAIAIKAMGLKQIPRGLKAELMFMPSDITHIRAYPFWAITIQDRTVYIDQLGAVYGIIKPSVPGD